MSPRAGTDNTRDFLGSIQQPGENDDPGFPHHILSGVLPFGDIWTSPAICGKVPKSKNNSTLIKRVVISVLGEQ